MSNHHQAGSLLFKLLLSKRTFLLSVNIIQRLHNKTDSLFLLVNTMNIVINRVSRRKKKLCGGFYPPILQFFLFFFALFIMNIKWVRSALSNHIQFNLCKVVVIFFLFFQIVNFQRKTCRFCLKLFAI